MPFAHVLAIDDDPMLLEVLRALLHSLGHTVETAQSAIDGVIAMSPRVPDVVLLDLSMPGVHGLDALPHLRTHYPAVPVVVMTGTMDPDAERHARELGAINVLRKPFGVQALADAIDGAMQGRPGGGPSG